MKVQPRCSDMNEMDKIYRVEVQHKNRLKIPSYTEK